MLAFVSAFVVDFFRDSPIRYWLTCFVIGVILELLFEAEEGQPWSEYFLNVRYGVLYAFITLLLGPTLAGLSVSVVNSLGGGVIDLDFVRSTPLAGPVIAFVIYLVGVDFFYYWFHRAQHQFAFLWDQHSLHHSQISVNVTTAVHHHWTETALQSLLTALPFAILFKLTVTEMGIISSIVGFWQFFIHANIRLPMGPLTKVFAGPQWHRIHHSLAPEHVDKNFAGHFPMWDVMFGTYVHPKPNEYPRTGLHSGQPGAASVFGAAVWPFVRWQRRASVWLAKKPR